jgi:hypothetical protein
MYRLQFEILGEVDGSMQNTASMLQIFRRMHSHSKSVFDPSSIMSWFTLRRFAVLFCVVALSFYDSAAVLNGTSGDCSVLLYFAQVSCCPLCLRSRLAELCVAQSLIWVFDPLERTGPAAAAGTPSCLVCACLSCACRVQRPASRLHQ